MWAFERSPSFRILGAVARAPFNQDALPEFGRLLDGPVVWPQVVAAAGRHRLLLPLSLSLHAAGAMARLPVDARAALDAGLARHAAGALQCGALAVRVAAACERAGLPVLFLKGVALSQRLYGRMDLRGGGDVDILVPPERMAEVVEVLGGLGIHPSSLTAEGLPETGRALHHLLHHEDFYRDARTGRRVEVHRRLSSNRHSLPWDFQDLWAGRRTVALGGGQLAVPAFGPEVLYLAMHGAGHGWERLRWLADVAVMLRTPDAMAEALEAGSRVGLRVAVLHTLALARRWLGLALPSAVEADLAGSRRARLAVLAARASQTGMPSSDPRREHLRAPGTYLRLRAARYLHRQLLAAGARARLHELGLGVLRVAARLQMRG